MNSDGSILSVSNTSISGCSGCHNELLTAAQPDVSTELQSSKMESDLVYENEITSPIESKMSNSRSVCVNSGFIHLVLFLVASTIVH